MKTLTYTKKLRIALIYTFIVITFIPMFHWNILNQYFNPHFTTEEGLFYDLYDNIYYPTVKAGTKLVLGTLWKMISPSWKDTRWINWYYENPDGAWERVKVPNMGPKYREKRSLWHSWLWDLKQPRFEDALNTDIRTRKSYAAYLCRQLKNAGHEPQQIRPRSTRKKIPRPNAAEGWSYVTAPIQRYIHYEVYPCK